MSGLSPRAQNQAVLTCVTCRARKVRCDGRPGVCSHCERLGFQCSYTDSRHGDDQGAENVDYAGDSGVGGGSGVNVPRRRVRLACLRCHAKKAKCSGTLPKCDRCQAQGLECLYRPGRRSIVTSGVAAGLEGAAAGQEIAHGGHNPGSDWSRAIPNAGNPVSIAPAPSPRTHMTPAPEEGHDSLALRAFDSFFRHVHHIPVFSFLHRASLMERYHAGNLDQALLLALIGITSLLTDIGTTADYAGRCIDEAATLVLRELEKPSVLRLQALVIVIKYRILSRRFSSAFMLHATACRFATALRLNYENPNLGFLARESRRRLMWSLYMIDSSIADGQADLAIWSDPETQIHLRLPCNERNFEFDLPEPTESLQPPHPVANSTLAPLPDDIGFLALHVRIQWIRCRILRYTLRTLSRRPSPDEIAAIPSRCADLVAELVAFEARLPLSFRWSESNLRLRTYSPRLCIFVMTHVVWKQCHLDLFRLFLPGLKDGLPITVLERLDSQTVSASRKQCYEHAQSLADMFAQLLGLDNGVPVTDLDLPACAYQCARVLDHGGRQGQEQPEIMRPAVLETLRVCRRIAAGSAGIPACAAIVSDIENLIEGGAADDAGRLGSPATGIPALDQPYPPAESLDAMELDPPKSDMPKTTLPPAPTPTAFPTLPITSPGAQPPLTAGMSGAHSSVESETIAGTAKSNAFDGALEGINFGPDSFDMDWSTAFSEDWLSIGAYRQGDGGES